MSNSAAEIPVVPKVGDVFLVRVHEEELTLRQLRACLQEGRTTYVDIYNPDNVELKYSRDREWLLRPTAGAHVRGGYAITAAWRNPVFSGLFSVRVVFDDDAQRASVEIIRADVF